MCLHVHTHAHTHTHTCTRTHTHTVCLSLKVRVLDMFFEEGSKVLYRLAVTCLVLYTEGLLGEPHWACQPQWGQVQLHCPHSCSICTEDAQSVNVETGLEEFVRSMSWEVRGAWFKVSKVTMATPPL